MLYKFDPDETKIFLGIAGVKVKSFIPQYRMEFETEEEARKFMEAKEMFKVTPLALWSTPTFKQAAAEAALKAQKLLEKRGNES
jgi:hypothetical protein